MKYHRLLDWRCRGNKTDLSLLARQCRGMRKVSYVCHRFPPDIIKYAVWLYFRFRSAIGLLRICCRNAALTFLMRPCAVGLRQVGQGHYRSISAIRFMSAVGQKQKLAATTVMSALPTGASERRKAPVHHPLAPLLKENEALGKSRDLLHQAISCGRPMKFV
jgi:hypothetical protein